MPHTEQAKCLQLGPPADLPPGTGIVHDILHLLHPPRRAPGLLLARAGLAESMRRRRRSVFAPHAVVEAAKHAERRRASGMAAALHAVHCAWMRRPSSPCCRLRMMHVPPRRMLWTRCMHMLVVNASAPWLVTEVVVRRSSSSQDIMHAGASRVPCCMHSVLGNLCHSDLLLLSMLSAEAYRPACCMHW